MHWNYFILMNNHFNALMKMCKCESLNKFIRILLQSLCDQNIDDSEISLLDDTMYGHDLWSMVDRTQRVCKLLDWDTALFHCPSSCRYIYIYLMTKYCTRYNNVRFHRILHTNCPLLSQNRTENVCVSFNSNGVIFVHTISMRAMNSRVK